MKYVKVAVNPQSISDAMKLLATPKYMNEDLKEITSGGEYNICIALRYAAERPFAKWIERARTLSVYQNMAVIKEEEYTTLTQPQQEIVNPATIETLAVFEALVLIRSDLGNVMKVSEELTKITGVKDVTIHFGPFDISIMVQAESSNDFGDKFMYQIQAVSGVREATAYPVSNGYITRTASVQGGEGFCSPALSKLEEKVLAHLLYRAVLFLRKILRKFLQYFFKFCFCFLFGNIFICVSKI
jgi:DNA-binding Lrp family transcriptional regulator